MSYNIPPSKFAHSSGVLVQLHLHYFSCNRSQGKVRVVKKMLPPLHTTTTTDHYCHHHAERVAMQGSSDDAGRFQGNGSFGRRSTRHSKHSLTSLPLEATSLLRNVQRPIQKKETKRKRCVQFLCLPCSTLQSCELIGSRCVHANARS